MTDGTGVLDRRTLDELVDAVGDDPSFLAELIDAFLEDAPAQLTAMRDASASRDQAALVRAAHTLKSSAATFGATVLAARCRDLEAKAGTGHLDDAVADVEAIATSLDEAVTALAAERVGGAES